MIAVSLVDSFALRIALTVSVALNQVMAVNYDTVFFDIAR